MARMNVLAMTVLVIGGALVAQTAEGARIGAGVWGENVEALSGMGDVGGIPLNLEALASLLGMGDADESPIPFPPVCPGPVVTLTDNKLPKPPGAKKDITAYLTVPSVCKASSKLPVIFFHSGFAVPARYYFTYATILAQYGFAVVQYDGAAMVPDSIVASWRPILAEWSKKQKVPEGIEIDFEKTGVAGHSRGGNIAALQLNDTEVSGGYMIDPVACGSRFAACGDHGMTGVYRGGFLLLKERHVMLTAAEKLSGFNDSVCFCKEPGKNGKCNVLNVHCQDVRQSSLFYEDADAPSTMVTVSGTEHWSFLMQPYVNIASTSMIAWLMETVKGDVSYKEPLDAWLAQQAEANILKVDTST